MTIDNVRQARTALKWYQRANQTFWAVSAVIDPVRTGLRYLASRAGLGKPMELLHNAASVPFNFSVTLWSQNRNHIYTRNFEQFIISYDLWEEKFKVVKTMSPVGKMEHLTSEAAEASIDILLEGR